MPRIITIAVVLSTFFSSAQVFAQAPTPAPTPAPVTNGPLNCPDYYTLGSVEASFKSTVNQTVPSSLLTFSGEIVNKNAYPLLRGTLFVKIFQKDKSSFSKGDGNPVVDQFVIKEGITLPANGTIPLTYEWNVPENAEGGEYYTAYFFTTENSYNLMGLSYTDDVIGNQSPFSIKRELDASVAKLSKTKTTLNGQDYFFAAPPLHFAAGEMVRVETIISNPSGEEKRLPLQWSQYSWDAMNPENLRHTKTELVTVPANGEVVVSYEVQPQRESVVYITAVTQDKDVKSFLNIRYIRDGIEETRTNFSAITSFPIKKDIETTLFVCAQAVNMETVSGNTLTLSLTDRDGNRIHEYRYEGDIDGLMGGYGEKFIPATDLDYVLLTATLERNGVIVEQVKTEYDCKVIDPSSCAQKEMEIPWTFNKTYLLGALLAGLGILVVIITSLFFINRRRNYINSDGMTTPLS